MKIPDGYKVAAATFSLNPAQTALAVADYLLNRPVPAEPQKSLGGVSGAVVKPSDDAVKPRTRMPGDAPAVVRG